MTAPPSRPYLMCTPPPQSAAAGTDHANNGTGNSLSAAGIKKILQTVADLAEHQPTTANLADDLLLTMVSGDDAVFYIRDVSQDHAVFPDELILVVNQCRCPA
ncbi:hypothetical protein Bbelb_297490 [Branchiostoma belcheri]|nr:hypothetical protein Bbelb_297490 [Branchiostoma belcheri]